MFKYIEDHIFKLEPDEFITDFEGGLRKSINDFFPRVPLRGCWFHYCAKIRQKFAKLGLSSLLKNDPNAKLIKHHMMNLPLLPQECFGEGYNHIKRYAHDCGIAQKLRKVFNYFDYWIQQVKLLFSMNNKIMDKLLMLYRIFFNVFCTCNEIRLI